MSSTYTHGHHTSVLRSHQWRTAANSAAYLLPHLQADMRLLDIGAGPGTITADFAEVVAGVVATEVTPEALSLSQEHITGLGLSNVSLEVQDAHALTFPDGIFDVVHAHQVLQHLADPVKAMQQMRRVTRPGGIVAARDSDYAAFAWYPAISELDQWLALYDACARANGGEPNAGRRLQSWARAAGFTNVTATSSTWCFSTPEDRAWWGGMWAERTVESAIARQALDARLATLDGLERIAAGWRRWAEAEDGWFSVLHGEILCRT